MFKVGDKVTVINKESYHFGKSGTIVYTDSSNIPYSVDFGDGYKDWFKESSLKLVTEFKYGDRVIQGNHIGIYIAQRTENTHFVLFGRTLGMYSNTTIGMVNSLNEGLFYDKAVIEIVRTEYLKLYDESTVTKMSVAEIEKVLQQCGKLVGSLEIVK